MLRLNNISKDYVSGDTVVHALKGVDIEFRKSEFVAVLGPSGCGKTTTGRTLLRLYEPTKGRIIYGGKTLFDRSTPRSCERC